MVVAENVGVRRRVTQMTREELEDALLRAYDEGLVLKRQYQEAETKAKMCGMDD